MEKLGKAQAKFLWGAVLWEMGLGDGVESPAKGVVGYGFFQTLLAVISFL